MFALDFPALFSRPLSRCRPPPGSRLPLLPRPSSGPRLPLLPSPSPRNIVYVLLLTSLLAMSIYDEDLWQVDGIMESQQQSEAEEANEESVISIRRRSRLKRKNCSRNSAAVPAPAPRRLPKEHESQTKQPAPRTRPITTPWCQPEQHPVVACHHEFQDSSPGVRCNSFSRPSTSAGGILPSSLSAGPAHGPAGSSPFAGPAHGPAGSSPFAGPAHGPAGSSPFAGPAHGPAGSSPFAGPAHGPAGSSPFAGPAHGPAGSSPFAGPVPRRQVQRMVR